MHKVPSKAILYYSSFKTDVHSVTQCKKAASSNFDVDMLPKAPCMA